MRNNHVSLSFSRIMIPALMSKQPECVIDGKGTTICYPVLVIAGDFSMEVFAQDLWVAIWQRL